MTTEIATEATSARKAVLAKRLDIAEADIDFGQDEQTLVIGPKEYLVLTEQEARDRLVQYVTETAWAEKPEFLSKVTGMAIEIFEAMQHHCEEANHAFIDIIRATCGIEQFVDECAAEKGRGHFIASYNGEEVKVAVGDDVWYVYRIA